MDQRTRSILNVISIAEVAWAVFEFVRAIMTSDSQAAIGVLSSPGVFFGLAVGGLAALAMLNWSLVKRLSPRARLHGLAVDAENLCERLERENTFGLRITPVDASARTKAKIVAFAYRLGRAKIPCPKENDFAGWGLLLPRLAGTLKEGTLRDARELWSVMQAGEVGNHKESEAAG